jgi:spoIIIJ-associated protein
VTNERAAQSITVSAKTVAEAIAEAEQRLGLPSDEIDVTVISEGSKGFLGMGGENARILAMPKAILARRSPSSTEVARPAARAHPPTVSAGDEEEAARWQEPQAASPTRTRRQVSPREQAAPVAEPVVEAIEDDDPDEEQPHAVRADPIEVAEVAVEVVRELLVRMGLDALATVRSTGNPVVIDITGDDLGLLIGRHGDTLGALQYLVNSIVGRRVNRWCKVIIDVEHYRMRREETLRALANRQASRVRQSRQELVLDPMPAAERRIIHMTLQNNPWVETKSRGEEPNRCVVIGPRQADR